jgi:hypothetical protein
MKLDCVAMFPGPLSDSLWIIYLTVGRPHPRAD